MSAPPEIIELIEHFNQQLELYRSGALNETQTRIEFIDPLFAALGWDISNKSKISESYKEVVHEDKLQVTNSKKLKAPDYSFRIGGVRKFFVEAKKPSVNVETNISAAFQLRRYGWSAKLPISILTDFEELAVYDCSIMPHKHDSALTARIKYYKYTQYIEKWDEIYNLFSKEAVLKGSLDNLEQKQVKAGITVDQAFLAEIETWRSNLATNLVWSNPNIKQRELNFAVQMIINRIIFLRICEDRGIEPYGQLSNLLKIENLYQELGRLFINADYRYNSGLFHFQSEKGRENSDDFTLNLNITDATLKVIIKKLYYPESPYEFSVIPVEILGQVYEQFLGKVIHLSETHQVLVEDKPEVRKAGGVYYTPSYIVDYIIKNTIGKLLEGKKPEQINDLTIIDPACGSGSFLIVAYQFLLNWYLDKYSQNIKKYKQKIYQTTGGAYTLTSTEKKRILINHIYGVDIDQQAVETTKLSLLLKVLEGESGERITQQLRLFKERALPDLDKNIVCGNSLIDGIFYQKNQLSLLDEDTNYRVNVFDWHDAFPEIMKRGGFDAVIGNPPYIRIQALKEWAALEVEFYKQQYIAASQGNYDIYVVFVEKGLNLLRQDGYLGFILPHKFFNANYGQALRNLIADGKHLQKVVHFGDLQIFSQASTYTCLLFLNQSQQTNFEMNKVTNLQDWIENDHSETGILSHNLVSSKDWNFIIGKKANLFNKLTQINVKLEDVTERIFQGIKTSADQIYIVEELSRNNNLVQVFSRQKNKQYWLESELLHPLIKGGDSKRYCLSQTNRLILFPYASQDHSSVRLIAPDILQNQYPLTWKYLSSNKKYLENREKNKMKGVNWYAYGRNQALDVISLPKIFTPDIAMEASFSWDKTGEIFFTGGVAGGYGIIVKSGYAWEYILALLNSRLLEFYLKQSTTVMRGGYYSFESRFIRHLPIYVVNHSVSTDKNKHDLIIDLVQQILSLNQQLNQEHIPASKKMIQQQIKASNQQINQLVYELYGLTDEEINMIDNSE